MDQYYEPERSSINKTIYTCGCETMNRTIVDDDAERIYTLINMKCQNHGTGQAKLLVLGPGPKLGKQYRRLISRLDSLSMLSDDGMFYPKGQMVDQYPATEYVCVMHMDDFSQYFI
jgi:hypothetical protein